MEQIELLWIRDEVSFSFSGRLIGYINHNTGVYGSFSYKLVSFYQTKFKIINPEFLKKIK